ncbi:MAG: adenine phosphoribosyltransferase [Firmicutes bacterium]|nr:adenine phosphoribosyltransferase [Bacillota bacterium]
MPIAADRAIALLVTLEQGVAFGERVGRALAEKAANDGIEAVVGTATLGIPLALEMARSLGLDHYVILQKSPKFYLDDALCAEVASSTSAGVQRLYLDRRSVPKVAGKRVCLVDDVVTTGTSLMAGLSLVEKAGAQVVGLGTILTEGQAWRERLGAWADKLRALGHIPRFARSGDRFWPLPE